MKTYTLREAVELLADVYAHDGIPLQEHLEILKMAIAGEEE